MAHRAVALPLVAAYIATACFLSGCGRASDADSSRQSNLISSTVQPGSVVELSQNQVNAIKIGRVGTYLFPIEKAELGSIGFSEDPATVQAESTLIGAAATFDLTNKTLARAQALGETNGIARKELEQAISDQQTAKAALKAARDAVRALGETDSEIDRMIAAGKIEAEPPKHKWAVANVLESDAPLMRVGQPVDVKVMAYPDRIFRGKISKIYATVDPNTHREVVRCEVEDPGDELRVGMFANFIVRVKDPVEAIAVAANSIVREEDGTMTAWVTTDRRRFKQRVLKTGLQENGNVQILDGLQPGELVVTDGAIFLDNLLQAPPSD